MVQVKVSEGILEGEKVDNPYGGEYYSFKGIPYAEPPTGDLRFKPPVSKTPWEGVRSAKEHGSQGCQVSMFMESNEKFGSEDCLYLNVYTPEVKPSKLLPVMFWIHGGGLFCGSGNSDFYGPEFLTRQNVILVSINYRLEVLGFLCLDTKNAPGNAGLKDQVAALRWVNKNIRNFGGDPDNVTIFGESAGGMSVSLHLISPLSKGLFKRAIMQSGCNVSTIFAPKERALGLARKLGFYSVDDTEIYDFYKSLPADILINNPQRITLHELGKNTVDIFFGPVTEKKFEGVECFLSEDPIDALRKIGNNVDIMIGITEHDGLIGFHGVEDVDALLTNINLYNEFMMPKPLIEYLTIDKQIELGKKMKEFYFKNEAPSLKKLSEYYTFDYFAFNVIQWTKFWAKENNVFQYMLTVKTGRNIMGVLGSADKIYDQPVVCHGEDLMYLFPVEAMLKTEDKIDLNSEELRCVDGITKLWTNFAKFGNPTPDSSLGDIWRPYTSKDRSYYDIGNKFVCRTDMEKEATKFWEAIFREYGPRFLAEN